MHRSFYEECSTRVTVAKNISVSLRVNKGLRKGCGVSQWSLTICMDGVVRDVYVRRQEKGVKMVNRIVWKNI